MVAATSTKAREMAVRYRRPRCDIITVQAGVCMHLALDATDIRKSFDGLLPWRAFARRVAHDRQQLRLRVPDVFVADLDIM